MRRARHVPKLLVVALCLALFGCGSSGGAGHANNSPIIIGDVAPITGSLAALAPYSLMECYTATRVINEAGGVLGRKTNCDPIDDYDDPADAVPNLSKALATTHFSAMVGLDSDVAAALMPIVNHFKIPTFTNNGLTAMIRNSFPYYWRATPPDISGGVSMGLWAAHAGLRRVALVFQNDTGDLGNKAGLVVALKNKGINAPIDETISGDQSSYESLVSKVIASKPQALLLSTDTQTAATLLANYKSLNGGKVPPLIVPTDLMVPDFTTAVKKVMGPSYFSKDITYVGAYIDLTSPEFAQFHAAMEATPQVPKALKTSPPAAIGGSAIASLYDGINVMALAMQMSHSTSGPVYNKDIEKITTHQPGAVVVHTFAQGKHELAAGHAIQYVGLVGPIAFDKYHNSPGEFAGFAVTPSGGSKVLDIMSPADVATVLKKIPGS